jgi:hypothetical protein
VSASIELLDRFGEPQQIRFVHVPHHVFGELFVE